MDARSLILQLARAPETAHLEGATWDEHSSTLTARPMALFTIASDDITVFVRPIDDVTVGIRAEFSHSIGRVASIGPPASIDLDWIHSDDDPPNVVGVWTELELETGGDSSWALASAVIRLVDAADEELGMA